MFSISGIFLPILVLHAFVSAASGVQLWPMGSEKKIVIVPYVLSGFNETQRAAIREGLDEIENATCVRFYIRKQQTDYVRFYFTESLGHGSLGRVGGRQEIALSPFGSMNKQRTMHEMIHTLGFHHVHQRFDRDQYVTVRLNNVKLASRFAFEKQNTQENRREQQGTPYDFDSIMHYPKKAFSKNGLYTIVPKNPDLLNYFGHAKTLSVGDALRINRLYNCPGHVKWN